MKTENIDIKAYRKGKNNNMAVILFFIAALISICGYAFLKSPSSYSFVSPEYSGQVESNEDELIKEIFPEDYDIELYQQNKDYFKAKREYTENKLIAERDARLEVRENGGLSVDELKARNYTNEQISEIKYLYPESVKPLDRRKLYNELYTEREREKNIEREETEGSNIAYVVYQTTYKNDAGNIVRQRIEKTENISTLDSERSYLKRKNEDGSWNFDYDYFLSVIFNDAQGNFLKQRNEDGKWTFSDDYSLNKDIHIQY